jgi:hypothetical protein
MHLLASIKEEYTIVYHEVKLFQSRMGRELRNNPADNFCQRRFHIGMFYPCQRKRFVRGKKFHPFIPKQVQKGVRQATFFHLTDKHRVSSKTLPGASFFVYL